MTDAKTTLLICLGVVAAGFVIFWASVIIAGARKGGASSPDGKIAPTPYMWFVGFVTDFFDTLGIGSFATTTSLYRSRGTIDDRLLPGTLNVGHTLPTVVQAFIYIRVIEIDTRTLIVMIAAAVAGSLLGAPIVCRWPRRNVQIGMGIALLVLCAVLVRRQFGDPTGGKALGLDGSTLWIGAALNFVLGALMTIGVGLYAPCLVLVAMLGMSPETGFPIMMGSCAFLMPLASVPFVLRGSYSLRAALGLALAGIPAVLIAAFIVPHMDLYWVNWLVAVVVIYTAVKLLQAASSEKKTA
jgi:uncharacterized membrane protein YfcA